MDREEGNNSNNCTDSDSGSASILGLDTDAYDIHHPRPPPPDVEVDDRDVALQRAWLHDAAYELLPPPLPPAHPVVRSRMRTVARLAAQMTDFWYEMCRPCLRSRLIPPIPPASPPPSSQMSTAEWPERRLVSAEMPPLDHRSAGCHGGSSRCL